MQITTLTELFAHATRTHRADCLVYRENGYWQLMSTDQLAENVGKVAQTLEALGVCLGDRVALMADNGPHWPTVDFAALHLGAVVVPIYPTLPPDQAAYIVADCGASVAFVEGRERLASLAPLLARLPGLKRTILIDRVQDQVKGTAVEGETLTRILGQVPGWSLEELAERSAEVTPETLATLIYTSGTTGQPKGVMLTHGNIASNVTSSISILDMPPNFKALSFLPLSHSFERTVDYTYFARGVSIAYAESVHTVARDLKEIEPHCFVSVPRVYEKILGSVRAQVSAASPARQSLFAWAEKVGRQSVGYRLAREFPPGWLGVQLRLADRLVFSKLRQALGRRFRFATSGGAPLARDIAEFFWGAGIEIYEGYGLSETAPILTTNRPGAVKLGTVGRPIPGVELRILEDGEIAARGPNIMQGYFNLPDDSAEVLIEDGWFLTGDIGDIDEDGYLRITDRKKEIIVNAYGKNVAPAPIENKLKASPAIEQAVVIGDQQKFLTALLLADPTALRSSNGDENRRAMEELIRGEVERVNRGLPSYEQIRRWRLVDNEFTVESGELTPTQKVKRRIVIERYSDLVEDMYKSTPQEDTGGRH